MFMQLNCAKKDTVTYEKVPGAYNVIGFCLFHQHSEFYNTMHKNKNNSIAMCIIIMSQRIENFSQLLHMCY